MFDEFDGFESTDQFRVQLRDTETHNLHHNRQQREEELRWKLPSAREISTTKHSLVPDMLNGWIPKRGVICPVPLNFDNPVINHIIQNLLKSDFMDKVVYIGPRFNDTYAAHMALAKGYKFKYAHVQKEANMIAYFKGFYEKHKSNWNPAFTGMNPFMSEHKLKFDAELESGNLDCAIKTSDNSYDLYLRVDSNTHGHCLWYYLKTKSYINQKVRFSICNLKASLTMYNEGYMNPYHRSSLQYKWTQLSHSTCSFKTLNYQFVKVRFAKKQISHNHLSFEYSFKQGQEVQFAYCIPYSYSQLQQTIRQLQVNMTKQGVSLQLANLCESLSGIDIPVLTFGRGKECVLISARVHPGETNGSWVMDGIMRQLSMMPQNCRIFQEQTFKLVPMLNPDGVIVGNFRSSLAGKDLNRCFCEQTHVAFPQVTGLRKLVGSLKQQFQGRLSIFIDLHGHSAKRNVFLYGMDSISSIQSRIFPKLLSKQTDMFRYYACSFKLTKDKRTTARGCFMPDFKFCYTIESSVSCYFESGKNIEFDESGWRKMGYHIVQAIREYREMINAKSVDKKANSLAKFSRAKSLRHASKKRVKYSKELTQEQNSTIGKYLELMKSIQTDDNDKFEQVEETDSQSEDYSKEVQQQFYMKILEIKTLFQQAYRNRQLRARSPTHNSFYFERKLSVEGKATLPIRRLTQIQKEQKIVDLIQIKKPRNKIFSFEKRQKKSQVSSEQSSREFLNVNNFVDRSSSKALRRTFDNRRLTETVYGPSMTFNLRLLAPQNYIRPSETPNNRGAYIGKQFLSRLRVKSNQSVH